MNIVLYIFIYSLLITFLFSISIIIAFPLFKDYYDKNYEGFLPVYNLFKLFHIINYTEFFAFLYLIPGINILLMSFVGFKLKNKVETYKIFKIGLIVFPIIFIPLIAYIKPKKTTKRKAKKEIAEEPEKFEIEPKELDEDFPSINLNDESIFKLRSKINRLDKENKPYKAKKVRVNEEFINSAPAEQEVIKKVNKNK